MSDVGLSQNVNILIDECAALNVIIEYFVLKGAYGEATLIESVKDKLHEVVDFLEKKEGEN